ncbi:MAG: hypothetical protein ACI396_06165 [Acutalibacteraceae bacterium]
MENNQKQRLYSLIFPVWVMLLLPWSWFVILPINLLIDSLVLLLIFRFMGIVGAKKMYLSSVMRTWIFGTLSSLVGFLFMLLSFLINRAAPGGVMSQVCEAITQNPFSNIIGLIWVLIAIAVSALCSYFFGLKFTFSHKDFPENRRKTAALAVAIITAPYTFLIPTVWFK